MGVVARGEIWCLDFGVPFGSEPGYQRPAVIISSNRFNRSRIATLVVAPVTSNLRLADAPGNTEIDSETSGLDRPSVVNVSQLVVVDRRRLVRRLGMVDRASVGLIDAGLRLVLAL